MYRQGRSLLKQFDKKPFAIVGVNTDANRDRIKEILAKENVGWRSFWDRAPEGPISSRWNIEGFPTMFLIDHAGILVGKVVVYDGKIFGEVLMDRSSELLRPDAKADEVIGRLITRAENGTAKK